jgi:hypothetical protein
VRRGCGSQRAARGGKDHYPQGGLGGAVLEALDDLFQGVPADMR